MIKGTHYEREKGKKPIIPQIKRLIRITKDFPNTLSVQPLII